MKIMKYATSDKRDAIKIGTNRKINHLPWFYNTLLQKFLSGINEHCIQHNQARQNTNTMR